MSWTQTHRRWEAMREIEALAAAGCTELPWNAEYADLFGDRDGLAAALRYRWKLTESTQLDTHLTEQVLAEHRARLAERQGPLLRMVEFYERAAPVANLRTQSVRTIGTERVSA
ncbi:MAG: hypothetical protein NTV23_10705 [Propionibacteriales bacterium]|nr:hypothetical protein [Propionibacteriales bacterium]